MIERITFIKKLAVFKNFDWNTTVLDTENSVRDFKKINIIYGRNYSGKTTLSRIIRALETGTISDKYESPELSVKIKDNAGVTQDDFKGHNKIIRVFNEDFIKDNLKFIINPDAHIQPFAILGGDNNLIEQQINELKEKLGLYEEGKETKLYKEFKLLNEQYQTSKSNHASAVKILDEQLSSKALDRKTGIKYQPERFGDQNYTTNRLKSELEVVLKEDYISLTAEEKKKVEEILNEKKKDPIRGLPSLSLKFLEFNTASEELIARKIGRSDKIEELVKDAVLNRWVKEGKKIHQGERAVCAFCNSTISEDRWNQLDRHFDEESNKLEKEIINQLALISEEKEQVKSSSGYKKEDFYSEFHVELEQLSEEYVNAKKSYCNSLESLEKQLNVRKDDLLNEKILEAPENFVEQITALRTRFDELRKKSDSYSDELGNKQNQAKQSLRLKEVYDFALDIKYSEQILNIETLKSKEAASEKIRNEKQQEIDIILSQIESKQKELKDESKGADKVNEYLNDYFGHDFLSLKAIEFSDSETGDKKYRFEVQRDGKKAHHLSEGECSLIAFCYFMAKLQDIDTKTKKPIIWIDDPISSLDSNHIFFIYTLINTKIFGEGDFEQLFVSTHNLEFLKYLKRLPGANNDQQKKDDKRLYRYLLIERIENESTIKLMPEFLREYVTEFNYLFNQIYKCSQIESVDDSNYTLFYNFGNNARKFLEIFLYYKFPDSTGQLEKMKMFFGDEDIPAVLTERINNEYSHLSGVFEREETMVEFPKMKKTANKIISSLKNDRKQFEALLKSIGESEAANIFVQQTTSYSTSTLNNITEQQKELLKVCNGNSLVLDLKNGLGVRDHKLFEEEYLIPAINSGLIKETRRKGKKKQYCLTAKGVKMKTDIIDN